MENTDILTLSVMLESINDRIIRRETIPAPELRDACEGFLSSAQADINTDFSRNPLRTLYWHIPRTDRKYPRNFIGVLPKTAIFADNFFELETLRFLHLYCEDKRIAEMCATALERLSHACIGSFCPEGECVGASISALRFLSAVTPDSPSVNEIAEKLIAHYNSLSGGMAAYSRNLPRFYAFLALTDLNSDAAKCFLREKTDFMRNMLTRGCLTGPSVQDTYNVRLLYILRNALASTDGYSYVASNPVYIREDGRCVCDI